MKNIEDGILARIKSRLSLIQRDNHPFMNGSAKLPQPILRLDVVKIEEEAQQIFVRTGQASQPDCHASGEHQLR